MIGTLPLQPGCVRLMLIRDVDTWSIVDAEVFFSGDEAVAARSVLQVGLDGEFRDYRPERTGAPRILWNDGNDYTGPVGVMGPFAFFIVRVYAAEKWMLTAELPGLGRKQARSDDPDELKATAERWLEEFVASLGAVFPGPAEEPQRVTVMLLHDPDSGEVVDIAVYEDSAKAQNDAQPTADDSGYRVQLWPHRPYVRTGDHP